MEHSNVIAWISAIRSGLVFHPGRFALGTVLSNFYGLVQGLGPIFWFRSYVLSAILVEQLGDKEDVVTARKNCEGENGGVNGRKIVAGAVGDARGDHNQCNCHNLDGSIHLTQPGRAESSKSGNDINCCGSNENEHVPANNCHRYPKWDWQVRG